MSRMPLALCAIVAAGCGNSASPATTTVVGDGLRTGPAVAPAEEPAMPPKVPPTRREEVVDTVHGVAIADPYRWLEDPTRPEVQRWMDAQDGATRAYLDALPERDAIAARLHELYYYQSTGLPTARADRLFYERKHADKDKEILYWRDASGEERVLIDPNQLSDDGSTALRGWSPSPDGRLLAFELSENNSDESTLYVLDVDTGERRSDVIAGSKYASPSWTPDSKGFYYTKLPVDPDIPVAERPGYAHIRHHTIGGDPGDDPIIRPPRRDPRTFQGVELADDGKFLIHTVQHGWTSSELYFQDRRAARPGPFRPLIVSRDALYRATPWGDTIYVWTNEGAPNGRIFAVDPRRPERARWKELVAEKADAKLSTMDIIGGKLVLTYLEDAHSAFAVHDLAGRHERDLPLPGLGTGSITGEPDAPTAYLKYSSYVEPTRVLAVDVTTGDTTTWATAEVDIDTSAMTVRQVRYPSRDGTEISMFLIHRKDVGPGAPVPTILSGYGGFNVSMTPEFSARVAAWVERGGLYAIPNLRGGGEYGETWHRAGMLENKQNVFDDFIAAAEYLIAEKWTSPARLAIRGGSNGGLLVGAAMVQRPDLFDVVLCAVPLLDMLRYHRFGSGMTWVAEYGSADDPAQFAFLRAYSPYHHVAEGTEYPALLMLAADSDDRVDPMHARKFTAAIQWATASDAPALIRIERNAGHGGAGLVKSTIAQDADMFAFVLAQFERP